jgi:hypothetical protein
LTDKQEKTLEILCDIGSQLEALGVSIKQQIAQIENASIIREETFNILHWQPKKGARLKEFDIAAKENNDQEKYRHALSVLKVNNATIEDRFSEPEYEYVYWTYKDTIYRQLRKPKA